MTEVPSYINKLSAPSIGGAHKSRFPKNKSPGVVEVTINVLPEMVCDKFRLSGEVVTFVSKSNVVCAIPDKNKKIKSMKKRNFCIIEKGWAHNC